MGLRRLYDPPHSSRSGAISNNSPAAGPSVVELGEADDLQYRQRYKYPRRLQRSGHGDLFDRGDPAPRQRVTHLPLGPTMDPMQQWT